jgi:TRAP-type C4-dicarboxylate transport system substrate-binding protein
MTADSRLRAALHNAVLVTRRPPGPANCTAAGVREQLEGIVRIATVVCLALVLISACAPQSAVGQEIRVSHQWAESADGRDRAVRVFVQEVEARAKGLKFRIHPNSSLKIKPTQLLAALQTNALEMAVYPLTYAVAKVPEFSLAGLPGLVPDLDAARALRGSEMHAMLQSLAEAHGFRIVTWWWAPGGFFAKDLQIFGPASVRGLSMRAADPLFERMLVAAGASTSNMPSTDIAAAMRSGEIDAVATTYEAFMSLRLYEQAKFATIGSSLFMGFSPLVMSLSAWNKLTPDQKVAFEEAAAISDAYFDAVERDLTRRMEKTLRASGVAIWRMSSEDYQAWLLLAQQTAWVEYATINPRAQELLLATVRKVLAGRSDKDALVDSIFGEDKKN